MLSLEYMESINLLGFNMYQLIESINTHVLKIKISN